MLPVRPFLEQKIHIGISVNETKLDIHLHRICLCGDFLTRKVCNLQSQNLQHRSYRRGEAKAVVGTNAQEGGGVGLCAHKHCCQLYATQSL